jgi:hypothetical protein
LATAVTLFFVHPFYLLDVFVLGEREEKRRIEKGGKKEGNETIEERERIPYPCLAIN